MKDKPASIDDSVALLAQAVERGFEEHPSPEELVSYHRDELPPSAADAVQEHLTYCRDCASLLLDLPGFFEPPDASTAGTDSLDDALNQLREQVETPAVETATLPALPARILADRRSLLALAAIGLAAVSLIGWLDSFRRSRSLEQQLVEATRPRFGVRIEDIAASGDRSVGADSTTVSIQVESDRTILILNPVENLGYTRYQGRILDQEEHLVASDEMLEPTRFGTFTLALARGFLRPGRYTVEVYGSFEAQRALVGRWDFVIPEPSEEPS